MTDTDPDYPRRILAAYNHELPGDSDKLTAVDVEQLRHLVDEYYARNIPPSDTINSQENPSRTMPYNNPNAYTSKRI